jgi:hypothetical protein
VSRDGLIADCSPRPEQRDARDHGSRHSRGAPSPAAGLAVLELGESFSEALHAAVVARAIDAAALRSALRAYVDAMRSSEPPERTLIAVKERVLQVVRRCSDVNGDEAGELLRQIVDWTIDAYYRAD